MSLHWCEVKFRPRTGREGPEGRRSIALPLGTRWGGAWGSVVVKALRY